jgi:hypothetical protein
MLAVFRSLRLKPGLVLRAYQFRGRGNGNGFVYATPAEASFPVPGTCERRADHFLDPPVPPGALGDVMEAIEGRWDALVLHRSVRVRPRDRRVRRAVAWLRLERAHYPGGNPFGGGYAPEMMTTDADAWQWTEPLPDTWQPTATMEFDAFTVTVYTRSALGSERIMRSTDRYAPGSYVAERASGIVAQGPGGFRILI